MNECSVCRSDLKRLKMLAAAFLAALVALAPDGASALQRVSHSRHDARIQYVDYRENDVVPVNAVPGRISVITFDPSETVVNYGSGFLAAWEFATHGNHFFLKPREANGSTNLFIATNRRSYLFDLRYRRQVPDMTYRMVFRYPEEEAKKKAEREEAQAVEKQLLAPSIDSAVPTPREALSGSDKPGQGALTAAVSSAGDARYNWRYSMNFGDDPASPDIAPEAVYDDGLFTVLRFRPGSDIPAVYQVTGEDPRTDESLLKTHVDPATGALIVEKVVREMRLRVRNAVVGIYNEGYGRLVKDPFRKGTSVPGVKRTFAPEVLEAWDERNGKDGTAPVRAKPARSGRDEQSGQPGRSDRNGGEP